MTPLEHYREAEARIAQALQPPISDVDSRDLLVLAQVHATLANAHMTAGVWGEEEET